MTSVVAHTHTPVLTREFVLAKCSYFTDVHLWPLQQKLNPQRWLENFSDIELPFALRLLESFYYFSEPLTNALMYGAFQGLSRRITAGSHTQYQAKAAWRSFVDRAVFTFPTGETPNVTDSGHLFARKARQVLGIEQERIVDPHTALRKIVADPTVPIVFVDDFVGTGWQFQKTWMRRYEIGDSASTMTFQKYTATRSSTIFYVPLVCTEAGLASIKHACSGVELSPAHILSARYSAVAPDSLIWPPGDINDGISFLREVGKRTGMPDTNGDAEDDWQGLTKLGLTLAFSHSVPDATLPIFYWEQSGWKPLIRRV